MLLKKLRLRLMFQIWLKVSSMLSISHITIHRKVKKLMMPNNPLRVWSTMLLAQPSIFSAICWFSPIYGCIISISWRSRPKLQDTNSTMATSGTSDIAE